jgi:phosphopantothenoylcysteine decarboxylase/phosphopantothenate--cysteine ligase
LQGIKLLVTAGPTYEDIDPVRYIGNRSSGKMGYEIAKAAFLRGADVTLISGPSSESSYQEIKLTKVRSAAEMQQAVQSSLNSHNALVMAAAVADFRPVEKATGKIKKGTGSKTLTLTETSDILVQVANSGKVVVGFALETENEELNAAEKLRAKNLDIIVLNSLNEEGAGFEGDTNRVTIFMSDGNKHKLSLLSKLETAHYILDSLKQVITRRYEK